MVQDCTQAVELNPRYVKALFRRAKALEKLDNKKECLEGETASKCSFNSLKLKCYFDSTGFVPRLSSRRHSGVYS